MELALPPLPRQTPKMFLGMLLACFRIEQWNSRCKELPSIIKSLSRSQKKKICRILKCFVKRCPKHWGPKIPTLLLGPQTIVYTRIDRWIVANTRICMGIVGVFASQWTNHVSRYFSLFLNYLAKIIKRPRIINNKKKQNSFLNTLTPKQPKSALEVLLLLCLQIKRTLNILPFFKD